MIKKLGSCVLWLFPVFLIVWCGAWSLGGLNILAEYTVELVKRVEIKTVWPFVLFFIWMAFFYGRWQLKRWPRWVVRIAPLPYFYIVGKILGQELVVPLFAGATMITLLEVFSSWAKRVTEIAVPIIGPPGVRVEAKRDILSLGIGFSYFTGLGEAGLALFFKDYPGVVILAALAGGYWGGALITSIWNPQNR